ncbi:phage holin [Streptococcus anginosus]|uniref:phage holin n=1 Tax=Streptococcus anginosus TaxID=1328 RepID=UPI000FF55164|nr:phage holin [Streptococcus anginosus]MCW1021626.1 phage holin [Streptococcus anginosus]RGY84365.1 holin [Streptococcus anginosus]
MNLTNKQYDIAKKVVTVVAPALITLITTIGALYKIDTTLVNGIIAAVTTFTGTVLGISSNKYQNAQNEQAGAKSEGE